MNQIKSKEKSLSSIFLSLAALFGGIFIYIAVQGIIAPSHTGLWFSAFLFLIFSGLFFGISKHQKSNYSLLGDTPLFIAQETIHLGKTMKGRIRINQPSFNKVTHVVLQSMVYKGGHYNNHYKEIIAIKQPCITTYDGDLTWLDFELEIPNDAHPTMRSGQNKYYWQMSIEYVDKINLVKRTWEVNINR